MLYVGKAKNLRRRLSNYRNATRKRAHRKMRILVREAACLTYESCESEHAALLLESKLIRELKPQYNVDGAFAFLYPYIGFATRSKTALLCFTTRPDEFAQLELTWYGCFRSRPRAKLAFHALTDLLGFVGHREKRAQLPAAPRLKGAQLVGFRQLPSEVVELLPLYFAGEQMTFLGKISRLLLTKPDALKQATEVQNQLAVLAHFFEADAARLRAARELVGIASHHVAQEERDALFIRAAAARAELARTTNAGVD